MNWKKYFKSNKRNLSTGLGVFAVTVVLMLIALVPIIANKRFDQFFFGAVDETVSLTVGDEPPDVLTPINYQTNQYNLGNNTFAQTSHLGFINYYNGSEFVPINTTIISSSNPLYDYEVTRGIYQTYFKANPTEGQVVKFMIGSEYITYQPMALNYRNDLNQIQQISMINSVQGTPNNNTFLYEDAYGSGIDLQYSYWNDFLKEDLIINSSSDLTSPEQYIINGGNATLDLDFILTTTSDRIFINGVEWDKKTTVETSNEVYIKDEFGNVLYYLKKPYAYDSNGSSQLLKYQFRKTGNSLYVIVKTPYVWISNSSRVYPVYIDPDTGATSPGTMADDDAVGTIAWSNPDNAKTSNNVYVSASLGHLVFTHYLKATNFGFSVSGTIDGIVVEIEKWRDAGTGNRIVYDKYVKIVKSDGSIGAEDKADTTTDWPTSDPNSYVSYGGAEDLWSEAWSDTDINDADFGVVLSAVADTGFPTGEPRVDHMRITVYYTEGAIRTWQDIGNMYWNLSFSNTTVDEDVGNMDFNVSLSNLTTNRDIGSMNYNVSLSNTTANKDVGSMYFNVSLSNSTTNKDIGGMNFNISLSNSTVNKDVGNLNFNVSFGNTSIRAWSDIGSMYFNVSMGNSSTNKDIGSMNFNVSLSNLTVDKDMGSMYWNVSLSNSSIPYTWQDIGNMYWNISFGNSTDELVWIEPGVYFDIDSDNDRFGMNKTLGFTQIVINETWIKFNDTSFNVTAGAFINISLTHIDDTPTVNTADELVCGFWANTTTGTVWYNISGFSVSGDYYVNLNGSALGNYDSNVTGVISFSHSGSGNRTYEIYNGTTTIARTWHDVGGMYFNVSLSNLTVNKDVGNLNYNISLSNSTVDRDIGSMVFNVSLSNSSSIRYWQDIGSMYFNVSMGNSSTSAQVFMFNVSLSNSSTPIQVFSWNVSFSNTTTNRDIGSMFFNVSLSNTTWLYIGDMYFNTSFSNSTAPLELCGNFTIEVNGCIVTATPSFCNGVDSYMWRVENDIETTTEWISADIVVNHIFVLNYGTDYQITLYYRNETNTSSCVRHVEISSIHTVPFEPEEDIEEEPEVPSKFKNMFDEWPQGVKDWFAERNANETTIMTLASIMLILFLVLKSKKKKYRYYFVKRKKR